jgi:hypothetical protein
LIVDGDVWTASLPDTIDAIIGDAWQHEAFLKEFELTAVDVPLVQANWFDWETPFSAVL